jgi:glycerol-3-phosphate dehydrogenase (NAD(P)+)
LINLKPSSFDIAHSFFMAKVGVIGGGAFGTAMACVIRRSDHDVVLWAREPEVVSAINGKGLNPVFLGGVPLVAGIRATADLRQAVQDCDVILMAVPAQHVRTIAGSMRQWLRRLTPVVSCSKGVERGSCALMPEVLADMLPEAVVAVLSGPSFAREIAADLPCGVVLACKDWAVGESLARQISNRHFCVHLSDDVTGAALAGAMKNVIAIASGIAAGRKLGDNARATLVTLGLAETSRLGLVKGAELQTFLGLAGAGDMMLTAHSLQSRNTSLGVALGEGRRLADVLAERKEVTEGVLSVEAVAALARQLHVEMPITQALDALLNRDIGLDAATAQLFKHLPALCRVGDNAESAGKPF